MRSTRPLGLAVLALAGACKRAPPPPPVAQPAPSASAPPDRLAPGEAAPGQERAHDLVLPRGSRIDRRYGTTVYATVPLAPEDLANWLRQECDDAEPIVGPTVTIFPSVHVRTAETGHKLRVEIAPGSRSDESSLIVDALQEQVPPTPMSNEEAMKKAGLTPDGKWLDPKHLE